MFQGKIVIYFFWKFLKRAYISNKLQHEAWHTLVPNASFVYIIDICNIMNSMYEFVCYTTKRFLYCNLNTVCSIYNP